MALVTYFFIAMAGTVFPPINAEFGAMWLGSHEGWPPLVVGVVGGVAQSLTYMIVYFFGAGLARRWKRFHDVLERVHVRHGDRLRAEFIGIGAFAGVIGLPPPASVAALAPGLGISLPLVLAVFFPARIVRLTLLAAFGEQIMKWWNG